MKKFLAIFLFGFLPVFSLAQSNVTGIITDTDGQPWAAGTVTWDLYNPSHTQLPVVCNTGVTVGSHVGPWIADGTGNLHTQTLRYSSNICPGNTKWVATVCPNATSGCVTLNPITITGADLSSYLTVPAPRFSTASMYGYTTAEVSTPVTGALFYNVNTSKTFQWNGSAWVSASGINIPMANQFTGGDFCAQLRNANLYAVANNYSVVDARQFPNSVSCNSDPITALDGIGTGGTIALTDLLPASKINTSVAWNVNNSGVVLKGAGDAQTIIAYTGVPVISQVLAIGGSKTNAFFVDSVQVRDLSVIGGNANATDAIALEDAGHGLIQNVSTWGVTGCGFHTYNSVTETFNHDSTSASKASHMGYFGAGYSVPTSEFCFDQTTPGSYTTDGTVTDAAAEGVTGPGWHLIATQGMTFTGGTSEGNHQGLLIDSSNNDYNTFINFDFESNSMNANGVDISDSGYGTEYINGIAISTCAGCNSVQLNGSSSIPPHWIGGKFTSIGGTQGTAELPDANFGRAFYNYGLGASFAAKSQLTTNSLPLFVFDQSTAAANYLGMCFSVNDLFCSTANSSQIVFRYWGLNNTSNGLEFLTPGGNLAWENGVLFAGFGAHGTLGQINNGWWKSLSLGSGATFSTLINPPSTPTANNTINLPSQNGTFALQGSTCTMTASTTCTNNIGYGANCMATVQGSTAIAGACSISAGTVTVTAATSNSDVWAFTVVN